MDTTVTMSPRAVFSDLWGLDPSDLKVYLTIGLLADEDGVWRHIHSLDRLVVLDECYTAMSSVINRLDKKGWVSIADDGEITILDPVGIFRRRTRAQVLNAARVRKHRSKKAGQ